jgi:hypothetical protein
MNFIHRKNPLIFVNIPGWIQLKTDKIYRIIYMIIMLDSGINTSVLSLLISMIPENLS